MGGGGQHLVENSIIFCSTLPFITKIWGNEIGVGEELNKNLWTLYTPEGFLKGFFKPTKPPCFIEMHYLLCIPEDFPIQKIKKLSVLTSNLEYFCLFVIIMQLSSCKDNISYNNYCLRYDYPYVRKPLGRQRFYSVKIYFQCQRDFLTTIFLTLRRKGRYIVVLQQPSHRTFGNLSFDKV